MSEAGSIPTEDGGSESVYESGSEESDEEDALEYEFWLQSQLTEDDWVFNRKVLLKIII